MPNVIKNLIKFLLLSVSICTYGQESDLDGSLVDQLEESLRQHEEQNPSLPKDRYSGIEPKNKRKIKGSFNIKGSPKQLQSLNKIEANMRELDAEIKYLSSQIENLNQDLKLHAYNNNMIDLKVKLINTNHSKIQSLQVKVNNHEIYSIDDKDSLWMPKKMINLFKGPLNPGRYRLDLSARIAVDQNQDLSITEDRYHYLNQSFDLNIPAKGYKQWDINIEVPTKINHKIKVALREKEAS